MMFDESEHISVGWEGWDGTFVGGGNGSARIRKLEHRPQPGLVLKDIGWGIHYLAQKSAAPTNESPAPVVSTAFTRKPSTVPRNAFV